MSGGVVAPHIESMKKTLHASAIILAADSSYDEIKLSRQLPEVRCDDVPVAMSFAFNDVRWWEGNFYRAIREDGKEMNAGVFETAEEAGAALEEYLRDYITIDGRLWVRTSEPVLMVGRDGLFIGVYCEDHHSRPDLDPQRLFAVDEVEAAVAMAADLRRRHPSPLTTDPSALRPEVELLMPEALTGPKHTDLVRFTLAEAEAEAASTIGDLMKDFTPQQLRATAKVLARAAERLEQQ